MKKITEQKVRQIARFVMSNDYPKIAITCIFDKFGHNRSTCEALTVLQCGKIIDTVFDKAIPRNSYIHILDNAGQKIKHQMIDSYPTSETFGVMYYDPNLSGCFEHLEYCVKYTVWGKPNCLKCFAERAACICVRHNQSIVFCDKCRDMSKTFQRVAQLIGHERTVNRLLAISKQHMLKERGL